MIFQIAKALTDKAYDADWIRQLIAEQDCMAHIPPRSSRLKDIFYSKNYISGII
jgi:hypothetical protein